jgi:4'-phosphopantetheinyl transferase EntD
MTEAMALVTAARALLPQGVAVASRDPCAPPPALFPGEELRATPRRLAEFAAGRAAARDAMAVLGLPPAAIPIHADRSPRWPAGLAGSITHSATACLAAVTTRPLLIGIDLEPATALEADLWSTILRPEEAGALGALPNGALLAKLIFSAKEAAYKAQYPRSKTLFGYDVIRIALQSDSFTATFTADIPGFPEGTVLCGRHCEAGGHFLTTVTG